MNTRLTNTKHTSLNESIAYVNSHQRELDEATEYAAQLEDLVLALCEELELDPQALVEDAAGVLQSTGASRLSRRIRQGYEKAKDAVRTFAKGPQGGLSDRVKKRHEMIRTNRNARVMKIAASKPSRPRPTA